MPKTVCLDFDGVMSDYHGWKGAEVLDPPRPGLREFLQALNEAGYEIAIHSTREPKIIWSWLISNGIDGYFKEGSVSLHKPLAFVYIDDRAVCFRGDYGAALAEIASFKAYWEKPKEKPTIAELEAILANKSDVQIEILPDGQVRTKENEC
jgi:hypothetical protein